MTAGGAAASSDPYVKNFGWLAAGLAHDALQRRAEALPAYSAAVEAAPTLKASATMLAVHQFLTGDRAGASAVLDAAYLSDSTLPDPWRYSIGDDRFFADYLARMRAIVGYRGPGLAGVLPRETTARTGLALSKAAGADTPLPRAPSSVAGMTTPVTAPARNVFRASSRAVVVDVAVRDGRMPVLGLTADDFEVFDNGVRQTIRAVSLDAVPLDVSVILEASDRWMYRRDDPDRPPYAPAQAEADAAALATALRTIDRLRVLVRGTIRDSAAAAAWRTSACHRPQVGA